MAQRSERSTGVRRDVGSIPFGFFFFDPRSRQVEYNIFLIYSPSLKLTMFIYLSLKYCLFNSLRSSKKNNIDDVEYLFIPQAPVLTMDVDYVNVTDYLRHGYDHK